MTRLWAIRLLAILALVGCAASEPLRLDGSSDAAFERSWAKMQSSLSSGEQMQLAMAMLRIRLSGAKSAEEAFRATGSESITPLSIKSKVAGLSFQEIIELAEQTSVKAELLE